MALATQNMLLNKRLLAVLALGFASGLPYALTGATLQAWFSVAHINLKTIGWLSLLGIPYSLKFLWSPIMDHFGVPFLGKRRGWIMLTQIGLIITIIVLAQMNPDVQLKSMMMVALALAFFSASQDIAIDAYRTDILAADERGLGAAYFVFAYRLAALVSGGLALVSAAYFGWKATYELMAVLMLLSMFPAYRAPLVAELRATTDNIFGTIRAALADLMNRDKFWLLILFVIFYKFGAALAMSMMTPFLLNGLGFTLTEVGLASKTVSFVATVLGAFLGGVILLRWSMYRSLLIFGLAQAFSGLAFVVLAIAGKQFTLMAAALFIENFCSGLSTAALFAFLMSLCNQRYSASQYASLSAIDSIGRVFLGPVAGFMVTSMGWVQLFIWAFVLCFPGLILLTLLKTEVSGYASAT